MALQIIDGDRAWKNLVSNKHASYPKATKDKDRLLPYANPRPSPSFQIPLESKVFTIGSCFAREVDKALAMAGINVVSRTGLTDEVMALMEGSSAAFNKYTVHSMVNEMRWALDPAYPFPGDVAFVAQGDGFVDLQLGGTQRVLDLPSIRMVRRGFEDAMRNAAQADVFIATLGLAEAWYDNEIGIYLNAAPTRQMCRLNPGRFDLRVMDYEEIYSGIVALCDVVRRFGKPGVKFLLTVSPVALLSTFRDQDVLVANTYSKSVQRAALERFIVENVDADYFPSFEAVTLTPTTAAWVPQDFRHVHPYMVRRIMGAVLSDYVGKDVRIETDVDLINAMFTQLKFKEIVEVASMLDIDTLDQKTAHKVGVAYKRTGDWRSCYRIYRSLVARYPQDEMIHKSLLQAARMSGAADHPHHVAEYRARFQPEKAKASRRERRRQKLLPWASAALAAALTALATWDLAELTALVEAF